MVLSVSCIDVSFDAIDLKCFSDLGGCMVFFCERVNLSFNRMLSVIISFIYFSCYPFWFRRREYGSECTGFWSVIDCYLTYISDKIVGGIGRAKIRFYIIN